MADRNPSRPPSVPPDSRFRRQQSADPHDTLTHSLSSLSLRTPSSSSPSSTLSAGRPSPALSRRTSIADYRTPIASSPGPDTPRRGLSRAPSTPNIRKRASMSSMNGSPAPTLRRKSSLLSMHSSPAPAERPTSPIPQKDMTPPPQDLYAQTTVILSDTSYGHKYARPRTSAAELANIVERPERIPAAVYGVAAAQIRAGKDRLSIRKTTRLGKLNDPEVTLVHAHSAPERGKGSWPEELSDLCKATPEKLKRGEVEIPHPYHKGDLYLSGKSLEDMQGCLGALYDGVDLVFGDSPVKKGFICIRPPGHHCAEALPSGFCFLNNVHIAIAHAAKDYRLTHAVILDFDLHHGDGSQAIAWSLNDLGELKNVSKKRTSGINVPTIGYFSMHDINSFPCESGVVEIVRNASVNIEAHNQFIHNVHMKSYNTKEEFWELYETRYKSLITKAREFLAKASQEIPKKGRDFHAGIFISAGFDASEHEGNAMQRHAVCVPTDFFAKFTSDAVDLAEEYCEGRVISVLEGGYSDRAITSGVFAHMAGLSCAPPDRAEYVPPSIVGGRVDNYFSGAREVRWEPEWWSVRRLEELEKLTIKVPVEKPREKRTTSFMSATSASLAKKAESPRRVLSSANLGPSPPPPPTPWQEQAYDLGRRFIPEFDESKPIPALPKADRTAPKTRHSIATTERTMVLRDRKPKAAPTSAPAADRTRRKTTAGPEIVSTSRAPSRIQSRAPSREPTPSISNPRSRATSAATRTSSTTGNSMAAPRPSLAHRKSSSAIVSSSPPKSSTIADMTTGIEELSSQLTRVKLTYKNQNRDRLEQETAQLERELAAAKREKTLKRAPSGLPVVRRMTEKLQSPELREEDEPLEHYPDSPPIVLTGINGASYGISGGHRVLEGFGSPGETLINGESGRDRDRDHTFRGGQIRFGEPFPGHQ
ncbi:histone deacetylase domain-containing protein [Geopyxis carbonaria]|nr:histone deacetylase domain-containing protein [Geopyxis carbonaria]